MFKNRELRIKLDKTPKQKNATPEDEVMYDNLDPMEIAEIAKDLVTHIAVVVGVTFAAVKVVSAASEIAVKRTPSKDRE